MKKVLLVGTVLSILSTSAFAERIVLGSISGINSNGDCFQRLFWGDPGNGDFVTISPNGNIYTIPGVTTTTEDCPVRLIRKRDDGRVESLLEQN